MREVLIEPSVEAMIKAGIIQESEKELYLFGIQGLVLLLVNWNVIRDAVAEFFVFSSIYPSAAICRRVSCKDTGKVLLPVGAADQWCIVDIKICFLFWHCRPSHFGGVLGSDLCESAG